MQWESVKRKESLVSAGVTYVVRRISFGRRMELMGRIRDLAARLEYFEAGRDEKNVMEASLLAGQIDRIYLEWGLEAVEGLVIDGTPAECRTFLDMGPEELVHEALEYVRAECGLSEQERKN